MLDLGFVDPPVQLNLDSHPAGQFVCISAETPAEFNALMRHYRLCKQQDAVHTSALVCIPAAIARKVAFALRGLQPLDRMPANMLFETDETAEYCVYHDAPMVDGLVAVDQLPCCMHALRSEQNNSVTFMLDARVAGSRASCLWDSGAKLSFISRTFVHRLGLSEKSHSTAIALADGTVKQCSSAVTTRVRIGQYREYLTLVVIDLAQGYDIILGDDWSKSHSVIADYGCTAPTGEYTPPSLTVRNITRRPIKLHPRACPTLESASSDNTSKPITALHAVRLLKSLPQCSPFLVLIREQRNQQLDPTGSQTQAQTTQFHASRPTCKPKHRQRSGTRAMQTTHHPIGTRQNRLGIHTHGCNSVASSSHLAPIPSQEKRQASVAVTAPDPDTHQAVQKLLTEFDDVFAELQLAHFRENTPECIPLKPGSQAPNRAPFRLSMAERAEVEKQVKSLLEKGFVVPSTSPYGAPVLFVPKPDGSFRMCIDYRALNKLTRRNTYPIPRIDDLLDNLSGATCFSSLDLASGYHQIVLQPSDCEKTAFNTHIGKYEFRVLPFGLTNAPAVFQHMMNNIFRPYLNKFVCVYLDDILVYSKTPEEHLQHLRIVLNILKQHGFKARPSKCEFFKPELKFLGHIVGATGMKPDPAKVATVQEWPIPRSVYDVRAFLGLANYFRKYMHGFAAIAAPLTDLLKGLDKQDKKGRLLRWNKLSPAAAERLQQDFIANKWTPKCQTAFEQLKLALTTAPVLVLPDFAQPFEVVADACETPPALGAVLLQRGHPVAFYSRKLSGPELNYSVSDIEMLAVIAALREWRCYLEGRDFTLITDHQPNTYLDETTNTHTLKRRARWLSESSGYNYTWVYKPGRLNPADPLSRAPQHYQTQASARTQLTALSKLLFRHVRNGPYESTAVSAGNAQLLAAPHCSASLSTRCQGEYEQPVGQTPRLNAAQSVTPSIAVCAALRIVSSCTAVITAISNHRCTSGPDQAPTTPTGLSADDNVAEMGADTPSSQYTLNAIQHSTSTAGNTTRRLTRQQHRRETVTGDSPSPQPTASEQEAGQLAEAPVVNPQQLRTEQQVQQLANANFVARLVAGYAADQEIVSPASQQLLRMTSDADGLYWTHDHRLVIPSYDNLRRDCIESVHSHPFAGHFGVQRTLRKAQEIFYWPSMRNAVEQFIRSCDSCQRIKARQRSDARTTPLPIPGRRWQSISMDFIMDLPTAATGNDAILVFVDRLSKMVHLAACKKTITAQQTASLFIDCVFKHHGMPGDIVSDRDVRFQSTFWRELVHTFGVKLSMSSRLHPQSDGQTERMNRTLEDTLRHFVGPYQTDWDTLLPYAEFAMNNAWHSGINNTPFMLNYGQTPDTPTVAFLRARHPQVNQFVGRWSQQIAHAKRCLQTAQDRMRAADRLQNKPRDVLTPGTEVLVHIRHFRLSAGLKHKLGPRWLGPFTVVKDVGPNHQAYKLELPPILQRIHPVIHVSDLKRYHPGVYQPPPLPDLIDGVEEYEVDFISDTRREGRRREYKIHWVGYVHPNWEKESQLTNCPEKVREFWSWKGLDCPHPIRGLAD